MPWKRLRFIALFVPLLLLVLVVVGQLRGPSEQDGGSALVPSTSATTADGAVVEALKSHAVRFEVSVPDGTVGPVWLRVIGLNEYDVVDAVPVERVASGRWSATVDVVEGALLRYRYDRAAPDDFAALTTTREFNGGAFPLIWRLALVEADTETIHDTVASWTDGRLPVARGRISGSVLDADGGEPLSDIEVSVDGLNVATGGLGTFSLDVAPGLHHVVVYEASGAYHPAQVEVEVDAGETASLPVIQLAPAAPVEVTFDVTLPERMPDGAQASIYGSTFQMGGWPYLVPNNAEATVAPELRRVDERHATITLTLHAGQYVTYRYHLGLAGMNDEWTADASGAPLRVIVVPSSATMVRDTVAAWAPEGLVMTTVQVEVPGNTPADIPLQIAYGPGAWLTATDGGRWQATFVGPPGSEWSYRYQLGDAVEAGQDATPGLGERGERHRTHGQDDSVLTDTVTAFVGLDPAERLAEGAPTTVTVRLSVAPEDAGVRRVLSGDLEGTLLPRSDDPSMLTATVSARGGEIAFTVEACPGIHGASGGTVRQVIAVDGGTVDLWSTSCAGAEPSPLRDEPFAAGMYTPDFFSPGFARLTDSTFDAAVADGASVVAISAVSAYGRLKPLPSLEFRSLEAGSVMTPRSIALAQAKSASERGLDVFLGAQFNMELTPGGMAELTAPDRTAEWHTTWLDLAEDEWLYAARLASELGATVLNLPGPIFHVFEQPDSFPDRATFEAFDARLAELVGQVREVYDGKILISGSQLDVTSVALADYAGVTTFDLGRPDVADGASVDEWTDAYEQQFRERIDPIHDHFGLPVFFYTIHVAAVPSAGDPTGEYQQAKELEAIYRAIDRRPWIAGALAWSYLYTPAPDLAQMGFRGRLAGAVQAKWFERFREAGTAG
jgi:hypothetical protein